MHIPTHCCPLLLNHPDHVPSLVPILVMLLNCVRREPLGFGLRRSRRNCASKTCRVKLFGEIFMQLLRRQWFPSAGVKLWLKFLRRDGFHRRGHAMLVQHCCRRLQLKVHHQLGEKLPGWTTALPALRPHVVDRSRRFAPRHASSASLPGRGRGGSPRRRWRPRFFLLGRQPVRHIARRVEETENGRVFGAAAR